VDSGTSTLVLRQATMWNSSPRRAIQGGFCLGAYLLAGYLLGHVSWGMVSSLTLQECFHLGEPSTRSFVEHSRELWQTPPRALGTEMSGEREKVESLKGETKERPGEPPRETGGGGERQGRGGKWGEGGVGGVLQVQPLAYWKAACGGDHSRTLAKKRRKI